MQYVVLDSNKQATHKFKDGQGLSWDQVKDFDNIAAVVPSGYVVLDFDTKSDADIMYSIITQYSLKCKVMKTTRGIHVWFKCSDKKAKNYIKNRLAIGIYADRRSGFVNSYVKIKDQGKMREWIYNKDLDDTEMMECPKWLQPISCPSDKFQFKGMGDGDGRNQELFNYIVYLQSKGFKKDEVIETLEIINVCVFEESVSDTELKSICRAEAFKSDAEIDKQEKKKEHKAGFSHNEFGDDLISQYHIICVNNQLYVYEDGFYQQDDRIIERKMIDAYPGILQRTRTEVLSYIRIKTHIHENDITVNPYIINLKNTRLDIRTGDCLPFTADAVEFDRIPVEYKPDAYCADLDKMLNRVFLSDREVINLFEEMVGYCLLKHSRYQKAFMLYGQGSNGKSTILDLIKKFLGGRNYSSISLEHVTDRFNPAELEHKLANIGDDVDSVTIRDTGTLKKLFAGNSIMVERKSERPFTITPYATHIYSANSIPRSFDKSDGFYRRWMFIPFNAKFSSDDPDYDPLIEDKITTPDALSYLLNVAIRGAQRLIKNGKFTTPACVDDALEHYKEDNSNVLSWINDESLGCKYFLEKSTDALYSDFMDWCKISGIKNATGKKSFYKEIIQKFDFESKPKQKADHKRYFVINLD